LYEDVQQVAEREGEAFIGSPAAKQFSFQKLCQMPLTYVPARMERRGASSGETFRDNPR
jgi:hypothetical protein